MAAGWTFPNEVGGWLTDVEGSALARLADGKRVLEVGSFQGRSTICMAQTAKSVVSVDHHQGDVHSGGGCTEPAFRANILRYGVDHKVDVHVQSFEEYAANGAVPGSFDLAFIDAAHDEDAVKHDAAAALRLVRPGGVVAFHDWDWASVRAGAAMAHPLFAGKLSGRAGNVAAFTVPANLVDWAAAKASVEVCIPLRDRAIDGEVLMKAHAACQHAVRNDVTCELTRVVDRYSVVTGRNRGVAGFLARDKSHLLFVDYDVLIPARTIETLVAIAAMHPRAIVSGCIPSVRTDVEEEFAVYVQVKPVGGEWLSTWPSDLVECDAVGGGCMLIPRAVFDDLEFPWFRWPEVHKRSSGIKATTDDVDFCNRVRALGWQVFATGKVRCGHRKEVNVADLVGR